MQKLCSCFKYFSQEIDIFNELSVLFSPPQYDFEKNYANIQITDRKIVYYSCGIYFFLFLTLENSLFDTVSFLDIILISTNCPKFFSLICDFFSFVKKRNLNKQSFNKITQFLYEVFLQFKCSFLTTRVFKYFGQRTEINKNSKQN